MAVDPEVEHVELAAGADPTGSRTAARATIAAIISPECADREARFRPFRTEPDTPSMKVGNLNMNSPPDAARHLAA